MSEKKPDQYIRFFWLNLFIGPVLIVLNFLLTTEVTTSGNNEYIVWIIPAVYVAAVVGISYRYKSIAPIIQSILGVIVGCLVAIAIFFLVCGALLMGL